MNFDEKLAYNETRRELTLYNFKIWVAFKVYYLFYLDFAPITKSNKCARFTSTVSAGFGIKELKMCNT